MHEFFPNGWIANCGLIALSNELNKNGCDLSRQIAIFNGMLEKLDPNSENFVNNLNALTDKILLFENEQLRLNRETIQNKSFCLYQMFGINNFNPKNRNNTPAIPQY